MKELCWWIFITILGVFFKDWLTGIDFFLPALILCYQKKNFFCAFFLGIIWILIQEGSGDIPFGATLLWYMAVSFFYFFLKQFLATNNLIFITILSFISSCSYYVSIWIISSLQEIVVDQYLGEIEYAILHFLY